MFGLTKREQQQAAWEREAALLIPAIASITEAALKAQQPPRPEPDCRTCSHYDTPWRCVLPSIADGDTCTNADRYDPLPPVRLWKKT